MKKKFSTKKNGRNNLGKITVRHRGGGVKRKYINIDFVRKENIFCKIEKINYDPNRNCKIFRVLYTNGLRKNIISINNIKLGDKIIKKKNAKNNIGNCKIIKNIPIGTKICCLELIPNKGAKIARSSGCYVKVISRESKYTLIKFKSGNTKKINNNCYATIGIVKIEKKKILKAGDKRRMGIRPTVRGVAMNPIDHPHGGGEGKTSTGRHPVSPWGIKTKGYKTKRKK
ncbi:50S ribosomal protein L2 [Candidatus Vidania fulgoroideae]|nr:50S ribosomal protein L2 [Candidatus Vidania fulgoroideae]